MPVTIKTEEENDRYAFIDGGYLRTRFWNTMEAAFGPDDIPDIDFEWLKKYLKAIRVFFYDARKEKDGTEATPPKQEWIQRQLSRLIEFDDYRLRLGAHSRSNKPKQPAGQKEVDVLLAVDLLSHSFAGNMREAIVLTGDLDFRPAFEEVVRHGTRLSLHYDEASVSPDLLSVAHRRKKMSFQTYYQWTTDQFKASHPLPDSGKFMSEQEALRWNASREVVESYRVGIHDDVSLTQARASDRNLALLLPATDSNGVRGYVPCEFDRSARRLVLEQYLPRLFKGEVTRS